MLSFRRLFPDPRAINRDLAFTFQESSAPAEIPDTACSPSEGTIPEGPGQKRKTVPAHPGTHSGIPRGPLPEP